MNNEREKNLTNTRCDSPEDVKSVLSAIKSALDNDPECTEQLVNEFGDATIAIPLGGNHAALDSLMEKQKLFGALHDIAQHIVTEEKAEGKEKITCCFTGHRPKRVPWLSDEDDSRVHKLGETLRALIDGLSMAGVTRYIAGNAEGFDTLAAETVLASNEYLELSKMWEGMPRDWSPAELEIAIPFEGHNANIERINEVQERASIAHVVSTSMSHTQAFYDRNRYMVDHSDIVIALVDYESAHLETSGTSLTMVYARDHGKTMITFNTRWLEENWPSIEGVLISIPGMDDQ